MIIKKRPEAGCNKFRCIGYRRSYKKQLLCIEVLVHLQMYTFSFFIFKRFVLAGIEFVVVSRGIKISIFNITAVDRLDGMST